MVLTLADRTLAESLSPRGQHAREKTVQNLLDQLPDDCTLEDVLYHLYVIDKAQKGPSELDAGKVIPHEQVAEEMRRKWQIGDVG